MKKTIGFFLLAVLLMTACAPSAPSKTEEELKAEIKAELKAEMEAEEKVNAEVESEEAEKVVLEEVIEEKTTVFSGLLSSNTAPYYLTLTDEYSPISINGKEYTSLAFDAGEASKFIDRNQFSYHLEGFPMFSGQNDYLEIEFDLNGAYESMGSLRVDEYKVISYNYGPLENKTSLPYPNTFYQDVIKTMGLGIYGAEEVDIKNNEGYTNKNNLTYNNEDFKNAVDLLDNQGYRFIQHGNYYQAINETPIMINHMPSVNEMCTLLNIDLSDLETSDNGGYFIYSTQWIGNEIEFYVYHDEPLLGKEKISYLLVKGLDYQLYGMKVGMNVLEAFDYLSTQYDGMYSHHDDTFAKYVFDVDRLAFTLNNIGFNDDPMIGEYDLVTSISLYELID